MMPQTSAAKFLHGVRFAVVVPALIAGAMLAASLGLARAQDFKMNAAQRDLYEKAKLEKEVSIWAPVSTEVDWIQSEVDKRFPGITVKPTGDLQAATKIIAEARAGRQTLDVWETSIGNMLEVQKRGLIGKTDWTSGGISKDDIFFDGEAAATHNFVFTLLYAKGKVAEGEIPKTWMELLNPKWRGKLIASDFLLPRLMGYLALEWGPAQAEKWGHAIIDDQKILITNAPIENFLRSGERLLDVGGSIDQSFQFTGEGIPTGFQPMDITPAGQFASSVMKNAPHPNAAALLANWLASDDGRATGAKRNNWSDIRPGSKSALADQVRKAGVKIIYEDASTVDQRADYYKQFSPLIRGQ
jgi:iron(III) transport system substrate-binding protein